MRAFLEPYSCPRYGSGNERPPVKASWLAPSPSDTDDAVEAGERTLLFPFSRSASPSTARGCSSAPLGRLGFGGSFSGSRPATAHGSRQPRPASSASMSSPRPRPATALGMGSDRDRAGGAEASTPRWWPRSKRAEVSRAMMMVLQMKEKHERALQRRQPGGPSKTTKTTRPVKDYPPSMFQSCLRSSRRDNDVLAFAPPPPCHEEAEPAEEGGEACPSIERGPSDELSASAKLRLRDAEAFEVINATFPEVDTVDLYAPDAPQEPQASPDDPVPPWLDDNIVVEDTAGGGAAYSYEDAERVWLQVRPASPMPPESPPPPADADPISRPLGVPSRAPEANHQLESAKEKGRAALKAALLGSDEEAREEAARRKELEAAKEKGRAALKATLLGSDNEVQQEVAPHRELEAAKEKGRAAPKAAMLGGDEQEQAVRFSSTSSKMTRRSVDDEYSLPEPMPPAPVPRAGSPARLTEDAIRSLFQRLDTEGAGEIRRQRLLAALDSDQAFFDIFCARQQLQEDSRAAQLQRSVEAFDRTYSQRRCPEPSSPSGPKALPGGDAGDLFSRILVFEDFLAYFRGQDMLVGSSQDSS